MRGIENIRIAANLREAGERLQESGANAFKAAAYLHAAEVVEHWPRELREIYERYGPAGLEDLPGIGRGIAGAIAEMLRNGRWLRLERLRSERSFLCTGADGLEHESIVLEPRVRSPLHGREAIVELLRRDRH